LARDPFGHHRAGVIRRDLSPAEVRVLGCLIEKSRTTPDQYPLTRNSARLACNQATNRDPVMDLDDVTVRAALERLGRNGLVRFTSTQGSRAAKYRHLAGDALGIGEPELAVLALLMLRGPQTPGELRGRAGRLHHFATTSEVEDALVRLTDKGLAVRFERRPGQKEQRFAHLLADERDDGRPASGPVVHVAAPTPVQEEPDRTSDLEEDGADASRPPAADPAGLEARVAALEAELAALRGQLADLLD
jgi:uncharacterized protein